MPQQLRELTPHFDAFLAARRGSRLLSQRYAIAGLALHSSIEDRSMDADEYEVASGEAASAGGRGDVRCGYFGRILGAAFRYEA